MLEPIAVHGYAQLTHRESLRDLETCLNSHGASPKSMSLEDTILEAAIRCWPTESWRSRRARKRLERRGNDHCALRMTSMRGSLQWLIIAG